jgi:hypothetical protein
MFMTHIKEVPTMSTPQHFQRDVIDAISHGGPGVPQGLTAFTGQHGDFENTNENKVRAFIITPYRRGVLNPRPGDIEFPYEVAKIKELLRNVLGHEANPSIEYIATGPDPMMSRANGKALIQYDPEARLDCNSQIAGVELWFEDHPRQRYTDTWTAFPNQQVPFHKRSNVDEPGGKEATDLDAEGRKEKEGSSCPRPNSNPKPTKKPNLPQPTFKTITTMESTEMTSSTTPTSTAEAPPPPPPPSKALSIILRNFNAVQGKIEQYNTWTFYEIPLGGQADGCKFDFNLDDEKTRWKDNNSEGQIPPAWPQGTFDVPHLHGEDGCQYMNDGNGAGVLHCPSMGDGKVMGCTADEDREKNIDHQCDFLITSIVTDGIGIECCLRVVEEVSS